MARENNPSLRHLKDVQVENLTVQCTGNGRKIWRLAVPDPEGKVEEELVVRFQGIISKVELQPGDVSKFDIQTAINISQAVEIVGLSSANFKQCVASTQDIYQFFSGHFDGTTMAKWDTADKKYGPKLRPATRFFTSTTEDPNAVAVPMGSGVDLLGALK
ncbi:hypothetical protein C8J57DRAFT_1571517, partial [Mycena rebaudengoi]